MKVDIKVPAVGESISEGTIAEWSRPNGALVKKDDVIMILETDKASVEVVAEQTGKLEIIAAAGETVRIGQVVGRIDTEGQATVVDSPSTTAPPPTPPKQPSPQSAGGNGKSVAPDQPLSPAVRRIVGEAQIDPSTLGTGSGRGGRLTKEDVLQTLTKTSSPPSKATPPVPTPPPTVATVSPTQTKTPASLPLPRTEASGGVRRVPMSKLRQTIARRLIEAQQTAAILTTFNEIDMSAVLDLRARYKEPFKQKYGVNLGFMGFFVKAAVEALKAFPQINAEIEGTDIIYKDFVNMGIAVSTDKGLIVPVIRNADHLSVAEIELAIRHYADKARDGKITLDDLAQGTFTISNGGVFGSLMSTPILNPPQSGILGLHKIEDRPMAVGGQVVIRPMMYVALSYDHRIVDGRESVSFLVKIKEGLEDPSRLLLEI